jgi:hypothetical protein
VKEPAEAGVTGIEPLPVFIPVNVLSVLLAVHPVLLLVFHDSVAPLPWITVADERLTVGCCTTVKETGCEAVASGVVQLSA